jgi:hypothetical protein
MRFRNGEHAEYATRIGITSWGFAAPNPIPAYPRLRGGSAGTEADVAIALSITQRVIDSSLATLHNTAQERYASERGA